MKTYTKIMPAKGAKPILAATLAIMVVAALALPAAAFAATATTDTSSSSSTQQQGQPPQANADGTMPEPPEGFDSSNMPSDMQGGPGGGRGMNPLLLSGGIGLIALAIGFAGGFAIGRATGKKAAKKELAQPSVLPKHDSQSDNDKV